MRRLAALVGTLVLVLVGAPAAQAGWSSDASISVTASAASVGTAQTGNLAGLAYTYHPTTPALAAAAPITVQNTGTRSAAVTVTVTASAATVAGLPGAVQLTVGTVASAAACTTTAGLTAPQQGTLAAPFAYAPPSLQLAAGASVVVCLRTALSVQDATAYGATSLQVTAQSKLTYAAGSAWTVAAAPVSVAQAVASTLLFFTDSAGRYRISLRDAAGTPVCVYRAESGGVTSPVRGPQCNGNENEWRLSAAATDQWFISAAVNATAQPTDPRWQAMGAASIRLAAPQAADAQRWWVIGRGDGSFQVVNVGTGACASLSTAILWDDARYLTTAVCNTADQRQAFTFTTVGEPIPVQPFPLTCGGNDWSIDMSWPANAGYQAESTYRVLLNGVHYATVTNGWDTHWRANAGDAALEAFVALHGAGTKQVEVQQSVGGSAWRTHAVGSVTITHVGTLINKFACT